jgi:Tfp pilus assembly protein, ATPase PilU
MHEHRADALQLVPGKPVSLLIKGGTRPVTKDPLSDAQIVGLVREIAPGDHRRRSSPRTRR